jgi:hypothetical protein
VLGDHWGTLTQLHINQVQHGAEEGPFLAIVEWGLEMERSFHVISKLNGKKYEKLN